MLRSPLYIIINILSLLHFVASASLRYSQAGRTSVLGQELVAWMLEMLTMLDCPSGMNGKQASDTMNMPAQIRSQSLC